ncbi:DUF2971 domain-containing protein [Priestia aryabhattai]|uniref:DUF2971 domain-containing protein n=1 Tax=Priestia aryabhattai TaxID=412384 RepID=UPI001FB3AA83|nr:DUF2971 domain-containing protein [Priestia aryabhattai]
MNQQKKLWRYIVLSKFIDLLNRKELFFTRLDNFEDPFEGASTAKDYLDREQYLKSQLYAENNSEAMWKLYLQSREGIAIQTTVSRLEKALEDVPIKYMSEVKYIDYQNDHFEGEDNEASVYFFKRNHFEHEKEYRVIIPRVFSKDVGQQYKLVDEDEQNKHFGIHIPVTDLSTLIDNVYISPTAPEWFADVVTAVMEKFNLTDKKGAIQKPIKSNTFLLKLAIHML